MLNAGLLEAGAVVQVGPEGLGVIGTGSGGDLPARLLAAVAAQVAGHGVARLGICASDPCRCAYVDRPAAAPAATAARSATTGPRPARTAAAGGASKDETGS